MAKENGLLHKERRVNGFQVLSNSPLLELLSLELNKFLVDVPYSSVSQFYEYCENRNVDERFGMSCAWQSFQFAKRMEKFGVCDAELFRDGRHIGLICSAGLEKYLIDPYLLHNAPINIAFPQKPDNSAVSRCESQSYPFRVAGSEIKPSKLSCSHFRDQNRLRLVYKKYSDKQKHYVISRMFNFNLDEPVVAEIPDREEVLKIIFHGEQNNLSIRIVHRAEFKVYELIYPLAHVYHLDVSERHLVIRDNEGAVTQFTDGASFKSNLHKMAGSLGISSQQLIDYVVEGGAIYKRHAPADIKHAKYTLEEN